MRMQEARVIKALFKELLRAPLEPFPLPRRSLIAPVEPGVYVIYGRTGMVLHVGRTSRGRLGLRQRLKDHLHCASSFSIEYLKRDASRLRNGCKYRCLVVKNSRRRALLEALAIGCLCPAHIGLGDAII